jgi:hypothetical protein
MRTTGRRRFLKSLGVAPLLPAAALAPQVAPPAPSPTPSPSPSPGAPGAMAWALTEAVRHRFGAQLTVEELAEVAKGIEANLLAASRVAERMRHGNADEPVTRFQAHRPPEPAAPPPPPKRSRGRRGRR